MMALNFFVQVEMISFCSEEADSYRLDRNIEEYLIVHCTTSREKNLKDMPEYLD